MVVDMCINIPITTAINSREWWANSLWELINMPSGAIAANTASQLIDLARDNPLCNSIPSRAMDTG